MANTLTSILVQILAKGMMTLRQQVLMTRLVNTDYSLEAKKKGYTIDIPLSSAIAATDVTPAAIPAIASAITAATTQITLSNWKHAGFNLDDAEVGRIQADKDFIPLEMAEAFKSLANKINDSVLDTYKGIYGYVGTAGTTPFGSGVEVASATNVRKTLHEQLCPRTDRRCVMDFAAEAAALNLAQFSDAEKRGSAETKVTGDVGRVFGIDWYGEDAIQKHTRGALGAGALTVNGAHATVGVKSISIAKGAGASWSAVKGDIISFAGDSQTYVITANVTVVHTDNTSVAIEPGLKIALAGGEAVTTRDTHVVNLAFHRDAFGLAMRAPDAGIKELFGQTTGNVLSSVTLQDPISKLVMRLELIRGYKMTIWDVDCLWGTALVDPPKACRLAG